MILHRFPAHSGIPDDYISQITVVQLSSNYFTVAYYSYCLLHVTEEATGQYNFL